MVKIFYIVDEDYGSRVEKGLTSTSGTIGTIFEKMKKTMGLSSDKGHTTVSTAEDIQMQM